MSEAPEAGAEFIFKRFLIVEEWKKNKSQFDF